MKKELIYTRLYSDELGESNFEDVAVPLDDEGIAGYISREFGVSSVQFRLNEADYDWDFHNAPAKQFVILLDGEIEITTSRGDKRKFGGGDILLVEDTEGKGHRTRNLVKQLRRSLFVKI